MGRLFFKNPDPLEIFLKRFDSKQDLLHSSPKTRKQIEKTKEKEIIYYGIETKKSSFFSRIFNNGYVFSN